MIVVNTAAAANDVSAPCAAVVSCATSCIVLRWKGRRVMMRLRSGPSLMMKMMPTCRCWWMFLLVFFFCRYCVGSRRKRGGRREGRATAGAGVLITAGVLVIVIEVVVVVVVSDIPLNDCVIVVVLLFSFLFVIGVVIVIVIVIVVVVVVRSDPWSAKVYILSSRIETCCVFFPSRFRWKRVVGTNCHFHFDDDEPSSPFFLYHPKDSV